MRTYFLLIALCVSIIFPLFSQQNTNQLTAIIIGSGSPKFNTERAGPSVLISSKNTQILVDMGNGTQANLNKINTKIKDLDGLLFTHHHLDHNEEFPPIFIQSLLGRNKTIIAGPKQTTLIIDNILESYEEDIAYRLSKSGRTLNDATANYTAKNLSGNDPFSIGDIKISYTPVKHAIATLAYRFDVGNESIVVSGDLTYSKTLPILAKNADYLIMDSGGAIALGSKRKSGKSNNNRNRKTNSTKEHAHVNLSESSQMAKEANVKNLVLTHFNFTAVDEEATTAVIRENYSGNVLYGKDLMVLPYAQNSTANHTSNLKINYPIVDTGIKDSYSDSAEITTPTKGASFYGQDANYNGNQPKYTNNGDGTITDAVTGLTWEQDMGTKMTLKEALLKAKKSKLGGYTDWRVPSLKELYSLILFTGKVKGATAIELFIDTNYFKQPLGNAQNNEREIDAQTWSSTEYVGKTMKNNETIFGVNFVDGRIKGYPKYQPRTGSDNKMYFRLVRGNTAYGKNNFIDNNDGTISDLATGLMWQKTDDGISKDWKTSLSYAENLELASHTDWRLPNAKELQSIVDYTRSVKTTDSPAIDPVFKTTEIKDPNCKKQYPYFWTSTTHLDGRNPFASAVYIAFGASQGKMRNNIMDVHGAGAQRSDPKSGAKENYPEYFGPQGDVRYVYNYVRAVRDITPTTKINTKIKTPQSKKTTTQNKQHPTKKNNNSNNMPPSFSELLEKMDTNKDQKLSKSEVKGKLKENFNQRDKNGDGFISEEEMIGRRNQ